MDKRPRSRFATVEDVMSSEFMTINKVLDKITVHYDLPDHSDINAERYPWSVGLLSIPSFYAARMWEYPFAIISSELYPNMKCLDIGCGMTPFTIFLKEIAKVDIIGLDPDIFPSGIKYKGHGVSHEFIKKTSLRIEKGTIENIPFENSSFDRIFCISVIEHLPPDIARQGMFEIARVLKPNGRAILTVDVNLWSEISRPLDLLWDSGLLPLGEMDLKWPFKRFGIFCDKKQPADVFGMILYKPADYYVCAYYILNYTEREIANIFHGSQIPALRKKGTFCYER